MKQFHFADIREDWYYSNQLLPRRIKNCVSRKENLEFVGFPRQWIPLFELFEMPWRDCSAPTTYIPIISEISDEAVVDFSRKARKNGTLRTLVESISALDPVLADFLYIIDHKVDLSLLQPSVVPTDKSKLIRLTSWQAYGRPEVLRFEAEVDHVKRRNSIVVALPCSRKRPYDKSRTHNKIWQTLTALSYNREKVDQIVITSLGVVPEPFWDHPVVLGYDAGVPDIYRVLRLARRFFSANSYSSVVDCLQFQPYSDILRILQREKLVKRIVRAPVSHRRHFYLRP